MADDDKVMAKVEAELEKNPDISNPELFEKAKAVDPAVGKLTLRQFHARYPLQVKRRKSAGGKKRSRTRAKTSPRSSGRRASGGNGNRDKVRDTFLRFASDLTGAEQRSDLVKVLASVDRYVDEVLKTASK